MSDEENPHRHCLDLLAHLSDYLDQDLEALKGTEYERHLQSCRACQVCLATFQRTVAICRNIQPLPAPGELNRRLMAAIHRSR